MHLWTIGGRSVFAAQPRRLSSSVSMKWVNGCATVLCLPYSFIVDLCPWSFVPQVAVVCLVINYVGTEQNGGR